MTFLQNPTETTSFRDKLRLISDFPKPGIQFLDIAPVLADREAFSDLIEQFAASIYRTYADEDLPDYIMGLDARGFALGAPLAHKLDTGFLMARKKGKLPGDVHSISYGLEYGEAVLELQRAEYPTGATVIIIDDILATGGSIGAAEFLCQAAGLRVLGVHVMAKIASLNGAESCTNPVHALMDI